MVISIVASGIAMYALDAYWQVSEDSTNSQQANATIALDALKQDMFIITAYESTAGFVLWLNNEAWWYSEFFDMPESKQK